ncbi:MAG: biosynthetic-type acetolactate synthase large subunit [Candidatus Geothermarchaeales archaeon]
MRGADAIVRLLERRGVEVVFGIPGGAIMDVYDALYDSKIRHILVRHEQGAAHAADGYARASGVPGVCMSTSGPGATNLVTGITTAYMDSSPVVAFTGQVPTFLMGADAFQESNTFGLTLPITKHNFIINDAEEIPRIINTAFEIATTGRKGPVLVDLPKDVQQAEVDAEFSEDVPPVYSLPKLNPSEVQRAVKLLVSAERPVIFVGGGVVSSGASEEVRTLTEMLAAPVVTSLMGKGSIPETHPLCLGMVGVHGNRVANQAVTESDVILGVGVRFSDRSTGNLKYFAPNAKIIHLDIDPSEVGKNVNVDVPLIGDAREAMMLMIDYLREIAANPGKTAWHERLEELRREFPPPRDDYDEVPIKPPRVIKEIGETLRPDDIVVTEVGQCEMWTAVYYKVRRPRTLICSGGLGTMGFGLPASIGAKVAKPESTVVDVAGDGSILMVCHEFATAVENDIPVIACVLDNRYLGMVRQWQDLFYDKRYSGVDLGEKTNFVKLAEAFGARGARVTRPSEIKPMLEEAIKSCEPYLLDIVVDREMNVLPMVPAGGRIDQMLG